MAPAFNHMAGRKALSKTGRDNQSSREGEEYLTAVCVACKREGHSIRDRGELRAMTGL